MLIPAGAARGPQGLPGADGPAGAPGGSDGATAGWVETGPLTGAALAARYLNIETPEKHGAAADGVTDDTAAIQAAIDAALAAGGGIVLLGGRYGWAGTITHRGGVSVWGLGRPRYLSDVDPALTDTEKGCLVATGAGATYVYGTSGNSSRDDNPGPLWNVILDGANVGGATAGQLMLAQSAQGSVDGVHVINSAADGLRLNNMCQNTDFRDCYIGYNASGSSLRLQAATAAGQGPGGNKFIACYFADGNKLLYSSTDAASLGAHTTLFLGCLFEQRQVAHHSIVHMDAGDLRFSHCIFTRSLTSGTAPTADALVLLENPITTAYPTQAGFGDCEFNGGAGAGTPAHEIRLLQNGLVANRAEAHGVCTATNADYIWGLDGGAPVISNRAEWWTSGTPNPTTHYQQLNSAGLGGVVNNAQTSTYYKGPASSVAFSVRRTGDSYHRYVLGEDGAQAWYDGAASPTTIATLVPAFGIMAPTGIWHFQDGFGLAVNEVTAASGALSLDVSTAAQHTVEFAAGATVTVTLANTSKSRIVIIGLKGNGSNTLNWTTGVSWAGGSAPSAPADGQWLFVGLSYVGSSVGWKELWRNSGTAASGVTSVNGYTGPAVTLGAADVGAVPTSRTLAGLDLSADRTAAALKTALGITEADVSGLVSDLAAKAPLASPTFTGDPQAPTPTAGDNDTSIATTAFVQTAITNAGWKSGTTATAIGTAAKTATIAGYTPAAGDVLVLTVTNGNTASAPTLNINGGGAVGIYIAGAVATAEQVFTGLNGLWFLRYSGTRWDLLGAVANYTSASTSEMQAGTATSVRWMTPALVAAAIAYQTAILTATTQSGTTYTLALTDAGKVLELTSASAVTVTVPTNASVAFPVGTVLELHQYGAGQVTVSPAVGVTIRTASSSTTRAQYSTIRLRKRATDEWALTGDLT